jgi:hypothetical protein
MQYVIPIVLAIIGCIICVSPFIFVLKKGWRRRTRDNAIRSNGIKATAVIAKIELGGTALGNEVTPNVRLSVLVENEKGEVYPAQIDTTIAVTHMPQFQPGTKIDVAYDPADPTKDLVPIHVVSIGLVKDWPLGFYL